MRAFILGAKLGLQGDEEVGQGEVLDHVHTGDLFLVAFRPGPWLGPLQSSFPPYPDPTGSGDICT